VLTHRFGHGTLYGTDIGLGHGHGSSPSANSMLD
jgi:hypothetical protein